MKHTIFFDLDGTLINSTNAIIEGVNVAYRSFNEIAPNSQKIIELIGHPLDFIFEHLGVEKNVEEYVQAYKVHYRSIFKQQTTLLPFAKDAIIEASRFANIGVITTKTGFFSRELLKHMGVFEYFDVVVGREDVINPKPHPEPIFKAMNILGIQKTFCWMIGDTPMDIVAARDAGIKSIAVLSGYRSEKELDKYATIIKPNAYEAVLYIKNFLKVQAC